MSAVPEDEVEIVIANFEGIRHLDILQGPASLRVLHVFGPILQPHANIPLRLLSHGEGEDISAVDHSGLPLNAGERSYPREHATEQVRMPPSGIEGADAARGIPCDGMAVSIAANVVL